MESVAVQAAACNAATPPGRAEGPAPALPSPTLSPTEVRHVERRRAVARLLAGTELNRRVKEINRAARRLLDLIDDLADSTAEHEAVAALEAAGLTRRGRRPANFG